MEVRVEKRKKNNPRMKRINRNVFLRIFLAVAAVCLLTGVLMWKFGQGTSLAGYYKMDKDSSGRYVFNVVEVVPKKNQAVLGNLMKERENLELQKLLDFAGQGNSNWWKYQEYPQLFFWEGNTSSTGNEPFTLILDSVTKKPVNIINNEIFKIYMMGIGTYDPQKTIYQVFEANAQALAEFDQNYTINYRIMTPAEFEAEAKANSQFIGKIHYIQVGGGSQLSENYSQVYDAIMGSQSWDQNFTAESGDISWSTALELYKRAISKTSKTSVSISGKRMQNGSERSLNIYKFYQMLNYFDDPGLFTKLLKGEKDGYTTEDCYINPADGVLHWVEYGGGPPVTSNTWNMLPYFSEKIKLADREVGYCKSIDVARAGNYIPQDFGYDNILLYDQERGYFGQAASRDSVNIILNFTNKPRPPQEDDEGNVKILEIEPCNSYWLMNTGNRTRLAAALSVDEEELSVTYATPNRLNGMAVDLVAEYDLILIGGDVSWFRQGSQIAESRYSHIGGNELFASSLMEGDGIIPQTLINGLLSSDYTTKEEFDAMITGQGMQLDTSLFPQIGNQKFLKNVELYLKLKNPAENVNLSTARFSGNDISAYMQRQLAEFVKSGQPVVVDGDVTGLALKQIEQFNQRDALNRTPDENFPPEQDARLYFALYGVEDETDHYSPDKIITPNYYDQLYSLSNFQNAQGDTLSLHNDFKPVVQISDTNTIITPGGAITPSILEKGMKGDGTDWNLSLLAASNTLSFNYVINSSEECEMTVIIDRNADGIFDKEGEGKTKGIDNKFGKQNNATDYIKNDKVYKVALPKPSMGEIIGTFTTPVNELAGSTEEFYEFRVVVESKQKDNHTKGVWTGYMRPVTSQRPVKILQILPYGSKGTKALDSNEQFKTLIRQLETDNGINNEFKFIFPDSENADSSNITFVTKSESQFAQECLDDKDKNKPEKIAERLADTYDLIIAGTDFNTVFDDSGNDKNSPVDIDNKVAEEVLQSYISKYQAPIIFTNDAMSFVNAEHYFTPMEQDAGYRDMTISEGKEFAPSGKFEETGPYKRLKISQREAEAIKNKNNILGKDGDGTTFFYKRNSPEEEADETEEDETGVYKALVRPVSPELISDQRRIREAYIGWEGQKQSKVDTVHIFEAGKEGQKPNKAVELTSSQLAELMSGGAGPIGLGGAFYKKQYPDTEGDFYYTKVGYITEQEARDLYEGADLANKTLTIDINAKSYSFYSRDVHASLACDEVIDSNLIVPERTVTIGGDTYYPFNYNGKEYLAYKTDGSDKNKKVKYAYIWQIRKWSYFLNHVADTATSLYPSVTPWNHFATQSLRYVLGMDRFGVTTELESKDKRDSGTCRRYNEIDELQGFTNEALLEYAYLPLKESPWVGAVNQMSIYTEFGDTPLSLGARPRTDAVEMLNEGVIGRYPFEIVGDINNFSEKKIPVNKNHGPLYQLDLERETGEGKIDDVTVWYTYSGSAAAEGTAEKKESQYFDVTQKDAGNNYYLYSKGKTYCTGFSLKDKTGGVLEAPLVPEQEMKLFINTIYAALNSSDTSDLKTYEAVVKAAGTVSNISRAAGSGEYNRYVCYYDEYDNELNLLFRLQTANPGEGDKIPAYLGLKKIKEDGGEENIPLPADSFELKEDLSQFPVAAAPPPGGPDDSGLSQDDGAWYALKIKFTNSYPKEDFENLSLVIDAPALAADGKTRIIRSEIQFVMRNTFDLD